LAWKIISAKYQKKRKVNSYQAGDVVVVNLGKTIGHEQKGIRPSVVIANPQVGGQW